MGWEGEACVGNTGSIPRLNFHGLCLQDSPLGIRFGRLYLLVTFLRSVFEACPNRSIADLVSAFPSGMNVAATWSTRMMKTRGQRMVSQSILHHYGCVTYFGKGAEHRDKGVDVQLGPVAGPLGRHAAGGRNWEGITARISITEMLAD